MLDQPPLTNLQTRDIEAVLHPYTPLHKLKTNGPLVIERGEGVFVYDTQGRATWYRFQGVWSGTDTVTANLDRATGPVWASSFNPASVSYTTVGTATITFTSATAATLTFNDGIVNRTVTLAKI